MPPKAKRAMFQPVADASARTTPVVIARPSRADSPRSSDVIVVSELYQNYSTLCRAVTTPAPMPKLTARSSQPASHAACALRLVQRTPNRCDVGTPSGDSQARDVGGITASSIVLDDSNIPSCPICLTSFSANHKPYFLPNCGHSICSECKEKSPTCGVCNTTVRSHWFDWRVNFTLLESISNLERLQTESAQAQQLQIMTQIENDTLRKESDLAKRHAKVLADSLGDRIDCSCCGEKEKRERMFICKQCAQDKGVTESDGEEKMAPFIICGSCAFSSHRDDDVIKYLPWKTNKLVSEATNGGVHEVRSMNELCEYEINAGAGELDSWNANVNSVASMDCSAISYDEAVDINARIKEECDLVCKALEDTLPSLRKFTKLVKESSERLHVIRCKSKTIKKEK